MKLKRFIMKLILLMSSKQTPPLKKKESCCKELSNLSFNWPQKVQIHLADVVCLSPLFLSNECAKGGNFLVFIDQKKFHRLQRRLLFLAIKRQKSVQNDLMEEKSKFAFLCNKILVQ